MSPAKATVSTMLRPLLLVLLFLGPLQAQDSLTLPCKFFVSPSQAEVTMLRSEGDRSIGRASEIEGLDLDKAQAKIVRFKFRVPLWFGDVWESKDPEFVEFDQLRKTRRFPLSGTLELPLSPWQRLQASLSFPSFLALLLASGLLLGLLVKTLRSRTVVNPTGTEPNFEGYETTGVLGQGGMGVVYSAIDSQGEPVAIKSVLPALSQEVDFRRRFEREVKACVDLSHPNFLKFLGFGVDSSGNLFSVAEQLRGETLKQHLKGGNYDPPRLALEVVEQVGSALSYLHAQSLVHRDVKPDNIFVCSDGTLKLMDLGLVGGDELTQLTRTGHVLGTAAYMAPEQSDNQSCPASDQYALGVILYEILAGRRPFTQQRVEMLVYQHKMVVPQPPAELEPRIPSAANTAILKMLEKSPADRFEGVERAREALSEALLNLFWGEDSMDTLH